MSGRFRRVHLERAIYGSGFRSMGAFARAIGYRKETVSNWVNCRSTPFRDARDAIASALDISPGADCDEVREADLEWLLEPVDVELEEIERMLSICDELN